MLNETINYTQDMFNNSYYNLFAKSPNVINFMEVVQDVAKQIDNRILQMLFVILLCDMMRRMVFPRIYKSIKRFNILEPITPIISYVESFADTCQIGAIIFVLVLGYIQYGITLKYIVGTSLILFFVICELFIRYYESRLDKQKV